MNMNRVKSFNTNKNVQFEKILKNGHYDNVMKYYLERKIYKKTILKILRFPKYIYENRFTCKKNLKKNCHKEIIQTFR